MRQSAVVQRGAVDGAGAGFGGERRSPVALGTRRRMRCATWGMRKCQPVTRPIDVDVVDEAACTGSAPANETVRMKMLRRVRMDVSSPPAGGGRTAIEDADGAPSPTECHGHLKVSPLAPKVGGAVTGRLAEGRGARAHRAGASGMSGCAALSPGAPPAPHRAGTSGRRARARSARRLGTPR